MDNNISSSKLNEYAEIAMSSISDNVITNKEKLKINKEKDSSIEEDNVFI